MDVLKVKLSPVDAVDIVINACEGGINYWGAVKNYDWRSYYVSREAAENNGEVRDLRPDEVLIEVCDKEDKDGQEEWYPITLQGLDDAVNAILGDEEYPHRFAHKLMDCIEPDEADIIIQYAAFGKVVFG